MSEFYPGVPVMFVYECETANVTLSVAGQPEKVVDLVFITRTKAGKPMHSSRYRLRAQDIRQLIGHLQANLAVVEGRMVAPPDQESRH